MESFAAKRGPDRNPEQDHRGDRSLDPFRETKDRRRFAQHYGCALGTAERHPWVGEIAGAPRIVPVKDGSLHVDAASFIIKADVATRSDARRLVKRAYVLKEVVGRNIIYRNNHDIILINII